MSDIDEELRFHRDKRIAEFIAKGATDDEARRLASARLGDVGDLKDYCRRIDGRMARRGRLTAVVRDAWRDGRYGIRQMRRAPMMTLAVILTLGLGIGTTTATWSVVHKLLISPIPGIDVDRIVRLTRTNKERRLSVSVTPELAEAWRTGVPSLEDLALFASREAVVDFGAGRLSDMTPTSRLSLPALLGGMPMVGRAFVEGDVDGVLISEGAWRRRFGARPDILGITLSINNAAHAIVGVLPSRFVVPFVSGPRVDVWLPMVPSAAAVFPSAVARVRSGTDRGTLTRELDAVLASVQDEHDGGEWVSMVTTAREDVGQATEDAVLVLFAAVTMVLLAGCANVANLLLARAETRRREFVIRRALGAGRGRLWRQVFAEHALLALAGWAFSLLVVLACLALARGLRPPSLLLLDTLALDSSVIGFSGAVAILTTVLFGLGPIALAAGHGVVGQLRRHLPGATADSPMVQWRSMLVIIEVALSLVLVIGGGLLVRTLIAMHQAPVGFEPSALQTIAIRPGGDVESVHGESFADHSRPRAELLRRVRAVPGVTAATWAMTGPLGQVVSSSSLHVEGQPDVGDRSLLGLNAVTPEYFGVTGTRIVDGRTFAAEPLATGEVIVSASLAKRYWPDQTAVGQRLRFDHETAWSTVVGVADDVRLPRPGARVRWTDGVVYTPFDPTFAESTLIVRGRPDHRAVATAVIEAAAEVNPAIKVGPVVAAETVVRTAQALSRFVASVLAAFSFVSLILAAVGQYGVVSQSVTRRWREMGIRRALGARHQDVLRPILLEGGILTVAGLVLGLLASLVGSSALRGLLFQVGPLDPMTFIGATTLLTGVSVVAVAVPALRATKADPAQVLRED
jgi:putative ABC transport system permease protein